MGFYPANTTGHPVSVHVHGKGSAYQCQGVACFLQPLLALSGLSFDRISGGGGPITLIGKGFCDSSQGQLCNEVLVCGRPCAQISINYTHIVCVVPPIAETDLNVTCNVTVSVGGLESSPVQLIYDSSITPHIRSVNGSEGSTTGGTALALEGVGALPFIQSITTELFWASRSHLHVVVESCPCFMSLHGKSH